MTNDYDRISSFLGEVDNGKGVYQMKQHLVTVESSKAESFEKEVNDLLAKGYKVKSTHIGGREVGSYDEYSIYQAILVKDVFEEEIPRIHEKLIPKFKE